MDLKLNFKPQYDDLVVIDSKMPQMNGFGFYREVKALDKKVKTCFLTAADVKLEQYSDDRVPPPPPPNCFVRIPRENERLLERIQQIMSQDV
jgi:two-component SAPR family response regulator